MDIIPAAKETLILSASSMDVVQSCDQKYDYGYNKGLKVSPTIFMHETPIAVKSDDGMQKGLVGHAMLEQYYKLKQQGIDHDDVLISKGIEAGQLCAATETRLDNISDVEDAFQQYHSIYRREDFRILAVEERFAKVLYEDDTKRFIFEGKIDLFVETTDIHPMDHKFESRFFKKTRLNNQFIIYPWATGCERIVINRLGLQKKEKKFDRISLVYSEAMVEEWTEEATYWFLKLYKTIKNGYYARNLTSCEKYGGCPYQMLCDANPEEREWRILNFYRKREQHEEIEEQVEEGDEYES